MSVSVPETVSDIGGGEDWSTEQVVNLQNALAMARAELRIATEQAELYRTALFACLKLIEHQAVHGVEP